MPLYSPLQKDEFEIRILDILPAEDLSVPIRCMFRHVLLTDEPMPRFTALSYTWGNPNPASEIVIDGTKRDVSPNLASALQHLRSKNEMVSLWVDAVCINQADVAEKTMQLLIMDDIYRDAERVLVWLGTESEDSNLAMEMIQRWAVWKGEHLGSSMGSSTSLLVGSDLDEIFSEGASRAVRRLLARPYWARVWIHQEVALGRDVYVHCGQRSMPFNVLEQANTSWEGVRSGSLESSDWIINFPKLAVPTSDALSNLIRLRQQQQTKIASRQPSNTPDVGLFEFLRSYQHLESTDPRDRIYALLGIYSPLSKYRSPLNPSYDKPPDQVFREVARFMIEDDNSLRPVVFARSLASKAPVTLLPSWVPDWTGIEFLVPMHLHAHANHGTETRLDIPGNARFSVDGKVLSLEGTLCDVVSALQPTWTTQYKREPERLYATIRDRFLPNGVSLMKAVFHVLAARHEPCLDISSMSEDQTDAYMIQALMFLRLLTLDRGSVEERSTRLTELAYVMFGRTDGAFLKIRDWFFLYERTADGAPTGGHNAAQHVRLMRIGELFWVTSTSMVRNRVFFETQNGTIGIGPEDTIVGDAIFRPPGFCGFFVLRRIEEHYVFVGEGGIFESWVELGDAERYPAVENGNELQTVDIW